MEIGRLAVLIGLITSTTSVVAYFVSLRYRRAILVARAAFGVAALATVVAFFHLMSLCANHRFEFKYVVDYTSADLHGPFAYAATWAGQEGSFLLWAFWTAVIGTFVAWKAGTWESRVMPFYLSTLALLFGILTWLSPFELVPHVPGMPWPPTDGFGLNPSLQNYWMAIHPPTIFFGFVSLSIAFSYAIAALIWRDYGTHENPRDAAWVIRVMPWVLMAVATLGVGLFMGGYWAYETQGWHGFWGWDPVENASLFPWLASIALAHGLIVQRSRGGMARTNLFLAVLAWNLFLYGTYLTRSGVLSNVSVHAFGMLANRALYLLLALIGLHAGLGVFLLLFRWRSVPGRPVSDSLLARDTAMVLAVSLMTVAAIAVCIGTSWSLISSSSALHLLATSSSALWTARIAVLAVAGLIMRSMRRSAAGASWWIGAVTVGLIAVFLALVGLPLLGAQYSQTGTPFQPPFYNLVGVCLLLPALIAMGAVPFLSWGETDPDRFLWRVLAPWFLAVLGGFGIVWFVLQQAQAGFHADTPRMVVVSVGTLSLFAAFANLFWLARVVKPRPGGIGATAAGLAALVGGVFAFWGVVVALSGALGPQASALTVGAVSLGLLALGGVLTAVGLRLLQLKGVTAGGWLAHAGIGLFFVGAVISNVYEHTMNYELVEGQPPVRTPFGYSIEFAGWTHDGKPTEEARKEWFEFGHGVNVRLRHVSDNDDGMGSDGPAGGTTVLLPVFHSVQRMNADDPDAPTTMRWPHIVREPARDFYVLVANDPKLARVGTTVQPGQTQPVATPEMTSTGYSVRYKKFTMNGQPGQMGTEMAAEMDLIGPDGRVAPFTAAMQLGGPTGPQPIPARIPGIGGVAMLVGGVDPATKQVTVVFELPDAPARWHIPLAVTNKPLINLVWLGVALMGAGSLLAMARRAREARASLVEAAQRAKEAAAASKAGSGRRAARVRPARATRGA